MLRLNNIEVTYLNVIRVLHGVSMDVPDGGIIALLGANGAGKTTTLKAISGLLHVEEGEVTDGSIEWDGERIDKKPAQDIAKLGIIQALEGRRVFGHLTTEENLMVGAHYRTDRAAIKRDLEMVYYYFPELTKVRNNIGGYLSGGEQQMLVIGRGLMSDPKLMLFDEISLGLAPKVTDELYKAVREIRAKGITILLVEQNVRRSLKEANRAYIIKAGRIVLGKNVAELQEEEIKQAYFGV